MTSQRIIVVNAGSSSIKASLFDDTKEIAKTQLDNPTPELLISDLLRWIHDQSNEDIRAFGHRIVHGGNEFYGPTVLNQSVKAKLKALSFLDPNHLPNALRIINLIEDNFPDALQVACFDTAFFHSLPRVAQIIPLPRKYESIGLRKYGFHGLSYQSVLEKLRQAKSINVDNSKIVCAHLGSGASLAAIKNGEPVDTTMAFTPASGIPMSSRSGNLDPGIASYLEHSNGISLKEFTRIANNESGLLGISETSADMLTLLQQSANDARSKEAIDVFCYEITKSIGALSAAMGGIDLLVFAGGIGEKAPLIRHRICEGLDYLGIALDDEQNQNNEEDISAASSETRTLVIHSDEEAVIAQQVIKTLEASHKKETR